MIDWLFLLSVLWILGAIKLAVLIGKAIHAADVREVQPARPAEQREWTA